MTIQDSI